MLRTRRLLPLLALGALALVGCVQTPAPDPTLTPTTPVTTPTAEPTSPPVEAPTAVELACADLVSPDAVYAFNPNLALLGDWTPDADTAAAEALDRNGVACRWVMESGGATMEVSVAALSADDSTRKRNEAFASSQMVPTYGDEAYFSVGDGAGTATVFQDEYWLVVTSEMFAEPGEPTGIIESALSALG